VPLRARGLLYPFIGGIPLRRPGDRTQRRRSGRDAGILLEEQDGLETIAELLAIVVADRELRAELCERGRRRLEFYDSGRAAARLRDALCRIAA
jgi:glycosyltransferase involved in cell wall biosynthesis